MGGANTKQAESEPPVSSIKMTDGLIQQLRGESEPQPQPRPGRPAGPWLPHLRPAMSSSKADNPSSTATQKAEHASSEDSEAQQSKTAQTHVQHKHEQKQQPAGRAELKAEAVSQQKVNQYADQLVKQYEASLKALPCQDEKTSCLVCYQRNQQDPLQCADEVAAFTKCARKASAVMA